MNGLFSKIIRGEIPSFKLYEDEWTYSFLDIRPVQPGHALVIPKVEVDYFADVPEPHYSKVFLAAKPISEAIKQATGCTRVGMVVAGHEVPHFHLHLIPTKTSADDLSFKWAKETPMDELKEMQEKILSGL